jgi:hypothetical protein
MEEVKEEKCRRRRNQGEAKEENLVLEVSQLVLSVKLRLPMPLCYKSHVISESIAKHIASVCSLCAFKRTCSP